MFFKLRANLRQAEKHLVKLSNLLAVFLVSVYKGLLYIGKFEEQWIAKQRGLVVRGSGLYLQGPGSNLAGSFFVLIEIELGEILPPKSPCNAICASNLN